MESPSLCGADRVARTGESMRLPTTLISNWQDAVRELGIATMANYHAEHNDDDTHSIIHATGAIYERGRLAANGAMGETITPPFRPTDFTGFGTMTWTVTAAMVTTYVYYRIGDRMIVSFDLRNTTVVAVTTAALQILIPLGLYAKLAEANSCRLLDNGVVGAAFASTAMDSTLITIQREDGAAFTAAATNTSVKGQIDFKVGTA